MPTKIKPDTNWMNMLASLVVRFTMSYLPNEHFSSLSSLFTDFC